MKHSWAHDGMAVEAMGLQSEVVAAEQTLVVAVLLLLLLVVVVVVSSSPGSVGVSVGVAVASHGTVGLAVTHEQRAETLERTRIPVTAPHPLMTQP
jgi:hypothetical protein